MPKAVSLVHAGRVTYSRDGWTLYADADAALAWNAKQAKEARASLKNWHLERKNSRAELPIGSATAIGLGSSTNGDVWLTGRGIAFVDVQPKRGPKMAPAKTLELLRDRVLQIPAQPPRVAGLLEITSGCLALFDATKPPPFTSKDIVQAVAAKKPREMRFALLVPLANGTYEATYEKTAKKTNWSSLWYEDELGTYAWRVMVTKKK